MRPMPNSTSGERQPGPSEGLRWLGDGIAQFTQQLGKLFLLMGLSRVVGGPVLAIGPETAVQLRPRLLPGTARAAAGSRRCFSCNGCAIAALSRVLQEDSRPLYPRSGSPNLPTTALCVPFYSMRSFLLPEVLLGSVPNSTVSPKPTARRQVTRPGPT